MTYDIRLLHPLSHNDFKKFELPEALNRLYPQLHEGATYRSVTPSPEEVWRALYHNQLWIAVTHKQVIAMGFLISCIKPIVSQSYGVIHDVITDQDHRGKIATVTVLSKNGERIYTNQSLAKTLIQEMILFAKAQKFAYLELTSKPRRVAANQLYQNLGFQLISIANPDAEASNATNLYRLYLQYNN